MLAVPSTSTQQVSSRSESTSRTCGTVVRAVTAQSIRRTSSSPGRYSRLPASSLPDDPTGIPDWERSLRRLAAVHQVLAVDVTDPRELDLPDVGVITVQDPESGRRREISTADAELRHRYAEAAAAQRDQIAGAIRRAGAAHLELRTDRDWVADIVRHVHRQRQLTGCAPARGAAVREGTPR